MNDLANKIYDFLKAQGSPVQFGDLCRLNGFKNENKKEIAFALRQLGESGVVFRYLKDGKAYYSLDKNKGEAVNPTKAFINNTAKALGGLVNNSNSATDIAFNAENATNMHLINAIDKLNNSLKGLAGDLGIELKNETVPEFTYNKNQFFRGSGYSIAVPDGFIIKTEDIGDRDFIAWLPSPSNPDDEYSALVTIYGGKELPFASAHNESVKLITPEAVNSMFLYEQLMSMREMQKIQKLYNHIYMQDFANGVGSCCVMNNDAHFYYLNIPAYDKCKMIRIDVSEFAVENEFEANEIADKLFKNIQVDYCVEKYDTLDSLKYTNSFNEEKKNEFLEQIERFKTEETVAFTVINNLLQAILEIEVIDGEISSDRDSVNKEAKKILAKWLRFQQSISERMYEQLTNFFYNVADKYKSNKAFIELYSLICESSEDTTDYVSINFGDELIKAPIHGYDQFRNKVLNNPLLKKYQTDFEKQIDDELNNLSEEEKIKIRASRIEKKISENIQKDEAVEVEKLTGWIVEYETLIQDDEKHIEMLKEQLRGVSLKLNSLSRSFDELNKNYPQNRKRIENTYASKNNDIETKINELEDIIHNNEELIKKLQKELNDAFFLNFGKKSELNNRINDLQLQNDKNKNKQSSLKNDLKVNDEKCNQELKQLEDKRNTLSVDVNDLTRKKNEIDDILTDLDAEITDAKTIIEDLRKKKTNFHVTYILENFDDDGKRIRNNNSVRKPVIVERTKLKPIKLKAQTRKNILLHLDYNEKTVKEISQIIKSPVDVTQAVLYELANENLIEGGKFKGTLKYWNEANTSSSDIKKMSDLDQRLYYMHAILLYLAKNGTKTCSEVAEHFGMAMQRVSPILEKLVADGLVKKEAIKYTNYYSSISD